MNSSLSQTLYNKFLALDAEVQGHIHAGLRSAPTTKVYKKWYTKKLGELQDARDKARVEWRNSDPSTLSRKDKMVAAAKGHDDLASVNAARRICEKNGWEY